MIDRRNGQAMPQASRRGDGRIGEYTISAAATWSTAMAE
jgi:hypothetical protein